MLSNDVQEWRDVRPGRALWYAIARVAWGVFSISAWLAFCGGVLGLLVCLNHPASNGWESWSLVIGCLAWFFAFVFASFFVKPAIINAVCLRMPTPQEVDAEYRSLPPFWRAYLTGYNVFLWVAFAWLGYMLLTPTLSRLLR